MIIPIQYYIVRRQWEVHWKPCWASLLAKYSSISPIALFQNIWRCSKNGSITKSSILIGFSINKTIQLLGYLHFRKPPYVTQSWVPWKKVTEPLLRGTVSLANSPVMSPVPKPIVTWSQVLPPDDFPSWLNHVGKMIYIYIPCGYLT
jgi:hypothetical protein